MGTGAGSCTCKSEYDSRCSWCNNETDDSTDIIIECQHDTCNSTQNLTADISTEGCEVDRKQCCKDDERICTWGSRLFRWLKGIAARSSHVHYHDFASSGTTSKLSAELTSTYYTDANLQLTSNDLVLIEHGANDGVLSHIEIRKGLELLFRRIFEHSRKGSYPTIIVMASHWTGGYQDDYEIVGRHYNQHLWSYKDIIDNINKTYSKLNDVQEMLYHYFSMACIHMSIAYITSGVARLVRRSKSFGYIMNVKCNQILKAFYQTQL